jgi:hypothetical protein
MALHTLGSFSTTSLSAFVLSSPGNTPSSPLPWLPAIAGNELTAADIASLMVAIKNDVINGANIASLPSWGGSYSQSNLLSVPNRGVLRMLPGDVIAWDSQTGWPILVSGLAANNAGWHFV